ncbi:hypothetical protein [Natrinema pallidum]|uniref:hypothetical protein n=1 Tax=Natrinema pallidum TaxID=69527 RepID=UPI000677FC87|nr:hypothetical protein [Natrinema pallidum]
MESNTERHQLTRCPLSLHKTQINPVATPAEAVDFWHRAPQNRPASLFTLNETAPADEAQDFTPWIANEIRSADESELEDTLGLELEVVEEEKSVGRYNVDILAEVIDDNRNVVIENQLNSSDHDHLGKSIAYASGVDADIIVWIAPRFYDEHRDAMQWLNENSREGVDLFAVRLEVWKIGNSDPAVRLNPVVEPSEWKEKA